MFMIRDRIERERVKVRGKVISRGVVWNPDGTAKGDYQAMRIAISDRNASVCT
jgi:hypothetical protein